MAGMPESLSSSPPLPSYDYVRTCVLCRQRRVKCDRQVPQCSNCQRYEANCVYPPGRGRAPKRPKGGLAPRLTERLSRLENIIRQLGSATMSTHEKQEISNTHQDSDCRSFDQDFSRLKVDESKSYYVNNALWVTLSNEVEELHDLLFDPAGEDAGQEPSPASSASMTTSPSSSQSGLNAAIFGYRAISSTLQHYHPSLPQAINLFAAFNENVAPLVRIFHMPTLTRVYWDAMSAPDCIDTDTEALLFAIHYSTVISLTSDQCMGMLAEAREAALERYRFAVEQAFARGNLLNTQNLAMLQAAVLYLSALPNEDDSRAAWSLTSLIYHIARTMGLHRDGTVFGLDPLETELRRRLWWQICIIDSRSSEYRCNEPIARGFVSDTKLPLHINDADLSCNMAAPPPESWDHATDMTLSLVRCDAIQTGLRLGIMEQEQAMASDNTSAPAVDVSSDADTKRQALVQGFEARLREKYVPICDIAVPLQFIASAVGHIMLGRFRLTTQYSAASQEKGKGSPLTGNPDSTNQLENQMRDELFQISVGILETSGMLLINSHVAQWSWYSKTHIQWGAMAHVLSELCARPQNAESDRAWDCVATVYEGWRAHVNRQDDNRLALWRPIRRLMAKALTAKARSIKEMQQTGPGWPSRATASAQQNEVASGSGLLSQDSVSMNVNRWYTPPQQTPSSMQAPDASLPGQSSNPYPGFPYDVQKVASTGMRGPLMELVPDYTYTDGPENYDTSWLADINPAVPPRFA